MTLQGIKDKFKAPALAVTLGAATVGAFSGAAQAETQPQYDDEIVNALLNGKRSDPTELIAASDYSRDNRGIGILIYKGTDSGSYTVESIGDLIEQRFTAKWGIPTETHGRQNNINPEATSISYFIDEKLYGPFNISQGLNEIPAMAGRFIAKYPDHQQVATVGEPIAAR